VDIHSDKDKMSHGLPPWLWLCGERTIFHHNPRLQGAGPFFVESAQRLAKQHHGREWAHNSSSEPMMLFCGLLKKSLARRLLFNWQP
jgi:hypothetical protein